MKTSRFAVACVVAVLMFLSGCANFNPNFEMPNVKLVSLTPMKSQGLEQRFDIGLRITNPNAINLSLVGVQYDIELDGYKLISGVSSGLPTIPAYGEHVIQVQASVSLLQGARFLASLLSQPKEAFSYSINAKLDTGLPIIGKVAVSDSGEIKLSSL